MVKKMALYVILSMIAFFHVQNSVSDSTLSITPQENSCLPCETEIPQDFFEGNESAISSCFFAPCIFDLEKFLDDSPELQDDYFELSEDERQQLVDIIDSLSKEFLEAMNTEEDLI